MRYPELAALDSTVDQDLGLTIQFKEDTDTTALTPGAYLALIVSAVLDGYATRHVNQIIKSRITTAYDKASPQARAAAATALGVDLVVEVPVTPSVPDTPDPGALTAGRFAASAPAPAPVSVTAVESPATPETWSQWTSRMLGLQ